MANFPFFFKKKRAVARVSAVFTPKEAAEIMKRLMKTILNIGINPFCFYCLCFHRAITRCLFSNWITMMVIPLRTCEDDELAGRGEKALQSEK